MRLPLPSRFYRGKIGWKLFSSVDHLSHRKIINDPRQSDALSQVTNSEIESVFKALFESDKNRLYTYIYAFMTDRAAADDIFQETSMVLWQDFAKFEVGTNFSKWANGVAFNRIREYRRKHKRYLVGLSDDFLNELQEDNAHIESHSPSNENRWHQLEHCTSLLPDTLKSIYTTFYVKNLKAQDIADETGRSIHAIRKAIHKLRKKLFDCVESKQNGDSE